MQDTINRSGLYIEAHSDLRAIAIDNKCMSRGLMANAAKRDTKKTATPGPKPDTLKIKGNWKDAARLF